jgi:TonB family protein
MSGERVLAFRKAFMKKWKPSASEPGSLEERLGVEGDRRLYGCMSAGSVLGVAFVAYVLTIHIIDNPMGPVVEVGPGRGDPFPYTLRLPESYHGPIHRPRMALRHNNHQEVAHHAPRPASRHPSKIAGTLAEKIITSQSARSDYTAYELIDKTMKNFDLSKLDQVSALTRTGETRLSGRRGRMTTDFSTGYIPDADGKDVGDGLPMTDLQPTRLPSAARVPTEIGKQNVSIDMATGQTVRSSAEILAVIRSHAPGLRHIYNTFLKTRPGFKGKVTMRFAISPSGQVVDVGMQSSTTDTPDFDAEVAKSVMAWKFDAVKAAGNDIVTVPFNFSE